jgi:hypothetical protein
MNGIIDKFIGLYILVGKLIGKASGGLARRWEHDTEISREKSVPKCGSILLGSELGPKEGSYEHGD